MVTKGRHFGEWLGRAIDETMLSRKEFAKRADLSLDTLNKWLASPCPNIRGQNIVKLAHALGRPRQEIEAQLQGADNFDANVESCTEVRVPRIPSFDLEVAAGRWVDVTDIGEVCDPRQIEDGRFMVRVRGDSMSPTYRDGKTVVFQCLRVDRDPIEIGKDYYVQRDDGMATFKRLESIDEDTLVLRALNRRKYPDTMAVDMSAVVRMAKAVFVGDPVD